MWISFWFSRRWQQPCLESCGASQPLPDRGSIQGPLTQPERRSRPGTECKKGFTERAESDAQQSDATGQSSWEKLQKKSTRMQRQEIRWTETHWLICTKKNEHSQCRRVSKKDPLRLLYRQEICWHELGHLSREETWRWLSAGLSEDQAVRRGRPFVPAPCPLAVLLLPETEPYPVIRLSVAFQSTAEHRCT